MIKSLLLTAALFLVFQGSYSQNIKFEHLSLENGLPVSWVRSVCKDKMGFVWIGTNNGFCRYDGYSIKSYFNAANDSTSLCGNQINKIKELPDGKLFITTNATGVSIFDPKTEKFRTFLNKKEETEKYGNIFDVQIAANNIVWCAADQGLISFDPKTLKFDLIKPYSKANNKNNSFRSIVLGKDGTAWASSQSAGVLKIELKTGRILEQIKHKQLKPSIKEGDELQCPKHIATDNEGQLWIASEGLGLWVYKNKSLTNVLELEANGKSDFTKYFNKGICFTNNKMWVGFDGLGIGIFNPKTLKGEFLKPNTNNTYSLNTATIQGIYSDESGTVWIQTYDGGLDIYNPKRFKFSAVKPTSDASKGLSNRSIWSFHEDPSGKIWIGTDGGGINILDPKNEEAGFEYIKTEAGNKNALSSNVVKSIEQTKDGSFWFGTYLGGICRFDAKNKKFKTWLPTVATDPKAPASNLIWSIKEDSYGTFWLACLGCGLDTLDRKTETFYHFNGNGDVRRFSHGAPYVIYEDHNRTVWVCTDGGGLYYYTHEFKKFRKYTHSQDSTSIPSNKVFGVLDDADGNFWVGTSNGLSKLDRMSGKFQTHKLVEGVMQPVVFCILQDKSKRLWISSNQGLFCYDAKTKKVDHYDKSDGLQGNEYRYGSCLQSSDGKLYFGGSDGYDAFYPENIKQNDKKPSMYLSDVLVFNKQIRPNDGSGIMNTTAEYAKSLRFDHNQSVITFRYIALNYTNSGKNQYAYRLAGFEKEWNYVGTKREVNYTNLDPGTYIFEVKASNNDSLWNEAPLQIEVIIVPPFWMTWWFKLLGAVFVITSSLAYYFNRINRLKERQRFLEEKVEERTADLKEANVALGMRNEEILQQQEEILSQRDELEKKNKELETKQSEITAAYEQVNRSFKNIQVISDFGQKITSTLDVEKINKMTYEYIGTFMNICSFGIGVYHEEKQLIEFSNFVEEGMVQAPFYIGKASDDNYLFQILRAKSEVVVNEVKHEFDDFIHALSNRKSYITPKSLLYFPLLVDNKLIGLMVVASESSNSFTEISRNNIKALASYIAIADDNASAYKQINLKNAAINGSIRYGLTIQKAMQVSEEGLKSYVDSFILSKPKDIVSGDFYWFSYQKDQQFDENGKYYYNSIYFAVVDCTGHGVPGAFMSMIGNRLLNSIVNEKRILSPSRILDELNLEVMNALQQNETANNDGMDVCLVVLQQPVDDSTQERKLIFAGAKLPLIYYSNKNETLQALRGDRQSIGGVKARHPKAPFNQHELLLQKNDIFYLGSDGLVDQCDATRKRFGSSRLYKILESNAHQTMQEQKKLLESELSIFMDKAEQRDDITIMGVKL